MAFEDMENVDDNDFDIDDVPPPEETGNRTFIIIASVLGAIAVIALICIVVYAAILRPLNRDREATQVAQLNAQNTEVAFQITQTLLAKSFTATPTPNPTATPTKTKTPLPPTATLIPEVVEDTPTETAVPPTATPTATATPKPSISISADVPKTWTLKTGEFPYCIARRFDVDPAELIQLSGLSGYSTFYAGMVLEIPQSGEEFPVETSLLTHPATYTVQTGDSIYSIASIFGDVDPIAIAATNSLESLYKLSPGQVLQIP